MHTIAVTQEIADWIMMPVRGNGGFQDFFRKLQSQLDYANLSLSLQPTDLGKIPQHIGNQPGGFENRLQPLAELLRTQGLIPPEHGQSST